ncbi:MAG TPA: GspH/FimT family pseudopilin [Thermoanaerobaculia bacterium]|jgi:prepilin-type N-terminal cleavage/methylation domain-containing protein
MKNPVSVRGPRGFTLIELLVVMAVMLALIALGIPALQTALHQSKIRGIVQETTVLVRLARIQAIKRSAQSVVRIVPSTGAGDPGHVQAFLDLDSDKRLGANDTVIGTLTLPSGTKFEDCNSNTDKNSVERLSGDPDGGPNILIFQSDGSVPDTDGSTATTPGGFRFNDPYDNCMEVHVETAATARIEVRKWNGTAYVPSGDNGKAWTWN